MLTAFTTLALLALLGWLYLLGGHGWFWLTDQRLPRVSSLVRRWPPAVLAAATSAPWAMAQTLPAHPGGGSEPSTTTSSRASSRPWASARAASAVPSPLWSSTSTTVSSPG